MAAPRGPARLAGRTDQGARSPESEPLDCPQAIIEDGPPIAQPGVLRMAVSNRRYDRIRVARTIGAAMVATVLIAGCATVQAAGPSGPSPLKIGVVLPLSGMPAELAGQERLGIQLAADLVNADGGVHGRQISLDVRDLSDSSQASSVVGQIKAEGASVVIGSYASDLSIAVSQAAADEGNATWFQELAASPDEFRAATGAVGLGPPAVMGGGVAPGGVVHPGPAPGRDPSPLLIVIRRPISGNMRGSPYLSIARLIRPLAVVIEILVAAHFAGHVTGRRRSVFADVTRGAPLVPSVSSGSGYQVEGGLVATHNDCLLARADRERTPTTSHLAGSATNGDIRGLRVGVGANPVLTGIEHRESQTWRIDLEILVLCEISGANRENAFRHMNLDRLVIQVQELECRVRVQTQRSRSHMNLRPSTSADPDLIASGKRTVDVGIHPVSHTGWLKRHRTADVTQPSYPA